MATMETTTRNTQATQRSERPLRSVLATNAVFSGLAGAVLAATAGPIADRVGVDPAWPVRAVGLALMVFALDVALVARAPQRWLVRGGKAILGADVAWLAGTAAVLAAGWFSPFGVGAALVTASVVAGFAIGEWRGLCLLSGR